MFRTALVALAAIFTFTAAHAETWTLHAYKHWQVQYTETRTSRMCSAQVWHADDVAFSMTTTDSGSIWYSLYDPRYNVEGRRTIVTMRVDRRRPVESRAEGTGNTWFMDTVPGSAIDEQFHRDVRAGRYLYINDGWDDYTISLHGSAAAMNALYECHRRLR